MGHCDRTKGVCLCMVGFDGGSCNRMQCPGMSGSSYCYGHGKCLSMSRLAEESIGMDEVSVECRRCTIHAPEYHIDLVYSILYTHTVQ
jgi:hypothetical protein